MTPEHRAAVTRAAKAITRAAQHNTDPNSAEQRNAMTDALLMHTAGFTRQQFLALVGDLAGMLANFYGADDLAADAEVTDAELRAWLAD